jgi:hypothetical protein
MTVLTVVTSTYLIGSTSDSASIAAAIIAIVIGVALLLIIIRDWTRGIFILFAWMIVEDSIRKYTGSVVALYFAKDFILLATYASYFLRRSSERKPLLNWKNTTIWAIAIMGLWGAIGALYSNNQDWIVSVVGLRMWFIYCPLIFLGIDFAKSSQHVRRLLILLISTAGIVSLLGLLQIVFGNEILNPATVDYQAKLFLEKVGTTGLTLTRPTSVFIDPGRYGKYSIMMLCVSLGIFAYLWQEEGRQRKIVILAGLIVGLVLIMNFLSGARTAIVIAPVIIILFAFLYRGSKAGEAVSSRATTMSLLALLIVIGGLLWLLLSAVRPDYAQATLDFADTTIPYFGDHYDLHSQNISYSLQSFGLLGNGVGSASIGIYYFTTQILFEGVETGYASVIIEFGVVGLILWGWIGFTLIRQTWKASRVLRSTPYYGLALAGLLLQSLFLFILFMLGSSIYQEYLVSSALWFLSGLILGLARARVLPSQQVPSNARLL